MKKVLTLCIVHQGDKVLLGFKKRWFGAGRWNGFGGKVQEGEGVEEAAKRELVEEAGIVPQSMEQRGVFYFTFEGDPEEIEVPFFCVTEFTGEPKESEEMRPQWFGVNEIPFSQMWPDDIYWFPFFLAGKNFNGQFYFKDHNTILRYNRTYAP